MDYKTCWEVMRCGRESDGVNVGELGVCAAAVTNKYDGVNDGVYGGRFCWAIAGTLCEGEVQGAYAKKLKYCLDCEFLRRVHEEQGRFFILTPKNAEDALK
ncbi:two-CW domain-containing protein [Chloroflexota bacterium]